MIKPVIFLSVILMLAVPLSAESSLTAKLELYDSAALLEDGNWISNGYGSVSVDFRQQGNRNVKSLVRIKAEPDPLSGKYVFSLSRAYAKINFPGFRAVIGKAPFSWGEGLVFNAGDILFGDSYSAADIMQIEFRVPDTWMTSVRFPLGPFSFAEAIIIPPDTLTGNINQTKTGGRAAAVAGSIKAESGYLYDWAVRVHKPYLSLQGNGTVNWHLSTAASFRGNADFSGSLEESLVITWGIYSMAAIGYSGTLNYRLEASVKPGDSYRLYIYPELDYSAGSGIFLFLRGLFSSMDNSTLIIPGFSWKVFQGLTIVSMASFNFPWDAEAETYGKFSILAGVSVVY